MDDNKNERDRVWYAFLDLEHSKNLNILTLLQIRKQLPDQCLLKFEMQIILREYLQRNILLKQGPGGRLEFSFHDYRKLIPISSMTKFL